MMDRTVLVEALVIIQQDHVSVGETLLDLLVNVVLMATHFIQSLKSVSPLLVAHLKSVLVLLTLTLRSFNLAGTGTRTSH